MLRSLIATTFAGLARNRMQAFVTIAGLALALAAALVIALFVRQQFAYESFIPGSERIFRLSGSIQQPGQPVRNSAVTPAILAGALAARTPQLEGVARLMQDFPLVRAKGSDLPVHDEGFAWVDPNFFAVVPLPALAGTPATALREPGTVVLTKAAARRYFGTNDMLGKELEIVLPEPATPPGTAPVKQARETRRLRVTAVLDDFPPETHLITEIFASGQTAGSALAVADAHPGPGLSGLIFTYIRTRPGVSAAQLQPSLDEIVAPFQAAAAASGTKIGLGATPIRDIQFGPAGETPGAKPTIDRGTVFSLLLVAGLIVLMAAVSYIALTTARAASRATEVAVRKAVGASRAQLVLHFLGESLIHILIALVAAMALVELGLPAVNALLGTTLSFDLLHQPFLLLPILAFTVLLTLLAGFYPALVLSSVRPAAALHGGSAGVGQAVLMREIIVAGQFALLVALAILALTMFRQTEFALGRSIAAQNGPTLILQADCSTAIGQMMRDAPSVASATCGSEGAFNLGPQGAATIVNREGQRFTPGLVDVDTAFFQAMELKPIAGRTLEEGDAATHAVVLNETAARQFGFATPDAAVGRDVGLSLEVGEAPLTEPVQIVGVVPDRAESVLVPANPLVYQNFLRGPGVVVIEAPGYRFAPVHREIEAVWARMGDGGAPDLKLLSQLERERYRSLIIQGRVAGACAVLALVIAMMGLFALASLMVRQRRREIGIRKALGADTAAVTRLLAWQFTRPILIAGLLALPLGYFAANRWLGWYAARVEVPAWLLAAVFAGAAGLAITVVLSHVIRVARERPSVALRHE